MCGDSLFSCILIDRVGSYKYVLLCECPDGVGQGTGDLVWLVCRDDRLGFVDSYSSIFVRSSQMTVQFVCKVSPYIFVVFSSAMCFCSLHIRASIIICITDPRISRVCRRARVRALYINAFLHMQQEGIHRYYAWLHISLLRLGIGPLHLIKDNYSTWQSARLRTQTWKKRLCSRM